ncbi:MAG TPA: serine hydrolase, partial [Pyrinomonadaceae bacterium]|nr:serine hydrolase [Pyrinomonadaceae bacterium]
VLNKRATGYTNTAKGYETAPYLDMSIPYAAGSLYSTVEDLYLWDQALYGEKILSAKSKELMIKPNLNNHAYGLMIRNATLGPNKLVVPTIMHGGGINGFNTVLVRMPAEKRLIVLLDNAEHGQYLNQMVMNILSILYDQPYELPKQSIADLMFRTLTEKDVAAAIAQYRDLKARPVTSEYNFAEAELNALGYRLLQANKLAEAVEILKLNVEIYPQSANAYDSLAEAYMRYGNKELAIVNYKNRSS